MWNTSPFRHEITQSTEVRGATVKVIVSDRPPLRWTDQICEDIQFSHDDAVAATGDKAGWRALIRDATRTTTLAT